MFESKVITENNIEQSNEIERSGQLGWLDENEVELYQFLKSINVRVESFTGLTTESAESYQMVNYGLGGHFMPHYDALHRFYDKIVTFIGNRLTTVLFYLSDVQHGGYTAFPRLNIVSPAEKGAAIVWDNLHLSNGNKHNNSYHGSCAILKGNKWIMTKWLHEKGQDLAYDWRTQIDE